MSEKPVALRLIQHMDDEYPEDWDGRAIRAELRNQHAEIERLREALGKSLTHEQILRIAATIDRSMPLESAKILFARRIEAALRQEDKT